MPSPFALLLLLLLPPPASLVVPPPETRAWACMRVCMCMGGGGGVVSRTECILSKFCDMCLSVPFSAMNRHLHTHTNTHEVRCPLSSPIFNCNSIPPTSQGKKRPQIDSTTKTGSSVHPIHHHGSNNRAPPLPSPPLVGHPPPLINPPHHLGNQPHKPTKHKQMRVASLPQKKTLAPPRPLPP